MAGAPMDVKKVTATHFRSNGPYQPEEKPMDVKTVTATRFRGKLRAYLKEARANRVVLVENRRQAPKYLVDKEFLDSLLKEREAILATLEILADRELTGRLLALSKTIDKDVRAGRLLTTGDVF